MSERNFPLPRPESGDDPRFCFGLLYDIHAVLIGYGYPPATGLDHVELQQILFRFLYAPTDTDTTDTEGVTG
jgi:hypothetical protein